MQMTKPRIKTVHHSTNSFQETVGNLTVFFDQVSLEKKTFPSYCIESLQTGNKEGILLDDLRTVDHEVAALYLHQAL